MKYFRHLRDEAVRQRMMDCVSVMYTLLPKYKIAKEVQYSWILGFPPRQNKNQYQLAWCPIISTYSTEQQVVEYFAKVVGFEIVPLDELCRVTQRQLLMFTRKSSFGDNMYIPYEWISMSKDEILESEENRLDNEIIKNGILIV